MIIKTTKYFCTKCGKELPDEYTAQFHQEVCEEDPCNSCKHRYYSPINMDYCCAYERVCANNGYKDYEKK